MLEGCGGGGDSEHCAQPHPRNTANTQHTASCRRDHAACAWLCCERARRGAIRVRSLSRQPPHLAVVMCSAAFTTHSAKMVSPPAAQNPRANDGRREEVPTTWAINHAPCGDTFTSFSSASSTQCLHSKQWPCFHAALECRTRLDLRRRTQL